MTFYVGQKVVAVPVYGTNWSKTQALGFNVPEPRQIYTVRDIYTEFWNPGITGIRLCEVQNTRAIETPAGPLEIGWRAEEFRPHVEKKTDISIFLKMLTPSDERIDA